MDRRGFLKLFGMGVGGVAIGQAIPFGRVWSFPKKIKLYHALPGRIDRILLSNWNVLAPGQEVQFFDMSTGISRHIIANVDPVNKIITLDSPVAA